MDSYKVSVVLLFGLTTLTVTQPYVYVYEIYHQQANTNRSVACGICEARGGSLARRPELDDWEISFGNWSYLESMDFWVDLVKTDAGQWYWGDGTPLNLSTISALPMTPPYNLSYVGLNCGLWNMAEPFHKPADCSLASSVLCQVGNDTRPTCSYQDMVGMKFNDSTVDLSPQPAPTDFASCKSSCVNSGTCWAADFTPMGGTCRHLRGATRPAVPDLVPDSAYNITGKTCANFEDMTDEDSDFVCNCGAITLPETQAAKDKFMEAYKEEVQKELIVPTETISAQIYKKKSATDERPSSTGIGFVGVTIMVAVFGSLILLDFTTLIAHVKLAFFNVKEPIDSVLRPQQPTESDA